MKAQFILEGVPTALKRPRVTSHLHGGKCAVRLWDPQEAEKASDRITILEQMKSQGIQRVQGGVSVCFQFSMKMPERMSKKHEGSYHCRRPDLDNMVKYYLDVMNDLVYDDDSCVVHIEASKLNFPKGRTIIEITSMEPEFTCL